MNPPLSLVHWPGRGRYHTRQLCGGMNRPRPNNGSGDSPRPPFLTEFVNRIGKLALVELIYHLFGGQPRLRIHPHIQGSFRLKTESSRCVLQLHGADTQVGKQSVRGCRRHMLGYLGERGMYQLDLRPVTLPVPPAASSAARAPVPTLPGLYRSQSNDPLRRGGFAISQACPAKPRVRSIKVPPRRTARNSIAGFKRTGTWLNLALAMSAPGGAVRFCKPVVHSLPFRDREWNQNFPKFPDRSAWPHRLR